MLSAPTGTITLAFTDIEGSTVWWERLREAFQPVLDRHNTVIRQLIERWDGYEVKSQGDSFMVAFGRVSDAAHWSLEVQRAMATAERVVLGDLVAAGDQLRVRIGLHTGEPFLGYDPTGRPDYFGPMVNRAARVAAAGHGGQILISTAARQVLEGVLPLDMKLRDLGEHRLRGIEDPEHLFELLAPDLPAREYPPLRTLATARTNLPVSPSAFIGREQELAALRQHLTAPDARLVTLTGPGGIGKTRTALQAAELCAANFASGVWWVELDNARSGAVLLERVAAALPLELQPQPSLQHQLLDFLRDRTLLLALDNVEQIPDAAVAISELLRAPGVKCLVTSRRALELRTERVLTLTPLPAAAAEALFLDRARARRPHFVLSAENAVDVKQLCMSLEGVPLAVELAASRAAALSPREIANRLGERFRLLQTRTPDLPPRQRALRAAIDWSYDLLGEEERSLLAQLSVFPGGLTLADAEAVCDALDAFSVFEGISELQSHSLLAGETDPTSQETRFSMLEYIRPYAAEKLNEGSTGAEPLRRRHAEHFCRFAQQRVRAIRSPDEGQALRQFAASLDNVRAAMDWAERSGEQLLCAGLGLALGTFLQRRSLLDEAQRRVETALNAADLVGGSLALRAGLLRARASLHLDRFEWAPAQLAARGAGDCSRDAGDGRGMAEADNLLGLAAVGQQEWNQARRLLTRAQEQFEWVGDRVGSAMARTNLGLVEYRDPGGRRDEAARQYQEALSLYRQSGDERGIAELLNNLGALAQERGELDEAVRHYEETLRLETGIGHPIGMARALSNLGEVAALQHNTERALRLLAAAECLFHRAGSPDVEYTAGWLVATARGGEVGSDLEALRMAARTRAPEDLVGWALD